MIMVDKKRRLLDGLCFSMIPSARMQVSFMAVHFHLGSIWNSVKLLMLSLIEQCVCLCVFSFPYSENGSAFLTEPPRCIATKLPIVALTSPSLSVLATHCNKISPSPACLYTSQKHGIQYISNVGTEIFCFHFSRLPNTTALPFPFFCFWGQECHRIREKAHLLHKGYLSRMHYGIKPLLQCQTMCISSTHILLLALP